MQIYAEIVILGPLKTTKYAQNVKHPNIFRSIEFAQGKIHVLGRNVNLVKLRLRELDTAGQKQENEDEELSGNGIRKTLKSTSE